jgi:hypothetical protein
MVGLPSGRPIHFSGKNKKEGFFHPFFNDQN